MFYRSDSAEPLCFVGKKNLMKQIFKMSPNALPVSYKERKTNYKERKTFEVEHNEGKSRLEEMEKNLTRRG